MMHPAVAFRPFPCCNKTLMQELDQLGQGMGFICGVLLMYMGEDDVIQAHLNQLSMHEVPCSSTLRVLSCDTPGLLNVDLAAGKLPHGWTIHANSSV